MKEVLSWLNEHFRFIVKALIIVGLVLLIRHEWREWRDINITTIPPNATKQEIQATIDKDKHLKGRVTADDVVRGFEKADAKPDVEWTSPNQKESDKEAQKVAKKDKADEIVKQTTEDPKTGQVVNKYVGLHLEKDFKVKAGFTVGGYNSINVGVQMKRLEVIYHKSITKGVGDSITAMYTIAQW